MPLVKDSPRRRRPTRLSRRGAKFIASFEGFRAHPYQDSGGIWTIGYGHTRGVGPGTKPFRSQRQGRRILRRDAAPLVDLIKKVWAEGFDRPIAQHELDMLISAGFNMGPGVFNTGRSLGDAIRRGSRKAIVKALKLYVHDADGEKLDGLVRRRKAEGRIFLHGYKRQGR